MMYNNTTASLQRADKHMIFSILFYLSDYYLYFRLQLDVKRLFNFFYFLSVDFVCFMLIS